MKGIVEYERDHKGLTAVYQRGYEPLNLENESFLSSDNFYATDLKF